MVWMVKVMGRVKNCRSASSPSMVEVSTLSASGKLISPFFMFISIYSEEHTFVVDDPSGKRHGDDVWGVVSWSGHCEYKEG